MRQVGRAARIEHAAEHVGDVTQARPACAASVSIASAASRSIRWSSVSGQTSIAAPVASATICQGTMFEWCSSCDSRMRSPGLQVRRAPVLRDEVDRLGRAAGENDLVLVPADEFGNPPPRRFIGQRHLGRARIDPAMDGGVILAQRARHRVDHRVRFLRRRGSIEIVPRRAVGGDEAGEIGAQVAVESGQERSQLGASSSASSAAVEQRAHARPRHRAPRRHRR